MRKEVAMAFLFAVVTAVLTLVASAGCGEGDPERSAMATTPSQALAERSGQGAEADGEATSDEGTGGQPAEGSGGSGSSGEYPDGSVKLEPELPDPFFPGTPLSFEVGNLDPNTGESRKAIYVPEGTRLVSHGKAVTGSYATPIVGELSYVTDGEKAGYEGTYLTLGPGKQWVQIDLGRKYRIEGVLMWHYHSQARVYKDVIVQLSNDPDFLTGVKTVFNNDHDNSSGLGIGEDYAYVETNEGRWINVEGVEAQYVRCYSKGNTSDQLNHYTEVEVYGRPVE